MRLVLLVAVVAGVLAFMLRAMNRERSPDAEYQALLDAIGTSSLSDTARDDLRRHIAVERSRRGAG